MAISLDMRRRELAALVMIVLALGGASCGSGNKGDKQIAAYHVKKGMTKKEVLSTGGLPNRTTRHCLIYFVTKPKPHRSRIRICFRHGRVSFIRFIVYG